MPPPTTRPQTGPTMDDDQDNTRNHPRPYKRLQRLTGHLGCVPSRGDASFGSRSRSGIRDIVHGLFSHAPETKHHGGEIVSRVFKGHGVKFVFALAGGHISPILAATEELGFSRVIDVRNEATAVFAADSVARLTGVPGVACVTAGPGVTNTITALKNAQMAQSPLVLIGGAAATVTQGRGALQDIDQISMMKSVVKQTFDVRSVRDIATSVREAFQVAASGVPGPVFIQMPLDVLYPPLETAAGMGLCERARRKEVSVASSSFSSRLSRLIVPSEEKSRDPSLYLEKLKPDEPVFLRHKNQTGPNPFLARQYLKFALSNLYGGVDFAAEMKLAEAPPLPLSIPKPKAYDVERALQLLLNAKRPVVVLGSQVAVMGPKAARLVVQALDGLSLPSFLGGMCRGLLGRSHRLHIRQNRRKALAQADVILLMGAVADFRLDYGRHLMKNKKGVGIVAVNRSKEQLNLNEGSFGFWKAKVQSQSDPSMFLVSLCKKFEADNSVVGCRKRFSMWAKELKAEESAVEALNRTKAKRQAFGRGDKKNTPLVNPLDLFFKLEELLPENSILVADGGDFVATASYILRPRGPLSWLDPGAYGTLGVGAGFALGAKLVHPEAQVWLVWGDGSAGYSIAEFDTFKRNGIPVIGLVGNDACWTQIEREQVPMFGTDVTCGLDYCDYDTVSKGYAAGGLGCTDPKDVVRVLKKAQEMERGGVPVVINVHIGKTDFREGSLSV